MKKKSHTLNGITTIYFVGIKGVGMTSLAIVAKEHGFEVSGSDVAEEFVTDALLKKINIAVLEGFEAKHINDLVKNHKPEEILIVTTGAHQGARNTECKTAQKHDIHVMSHGEALGLFMQEKKGISIAGTHGKTTTSAMVAHILSKAKKDPSYVVGAGEILSLHTSGHWGTGDYFVAEADEYISDPTSDKTPRFLYHHPEIAVVTSIDFDHPDVYDSLEEVSEAFEKFIKQTGPKGTSIINTDDPNVKKLISSLKQPVITYGVSDQATVRIGSVSSTQHETHFSLIQKDRTICTVTIGVPGIHNVHNATAAIIAAHEAGVAWQTAAKYLKSFTGTKRRFEYLGDYNGIMLYDDYAHHPREIAATLRAAKSWYPHARIVVLFQPHTYSRTKALFNEFITSFSKATIAGILPIFASAREKKDTSISSKKLVGEIQKQNPHCYFLPDTQAFTEKIAPLLQPGDILITMGAGDIYTWHTKIQESIQQAKKPSKKQHTKRESRT